MKSLFSTLSLLAALSVSAGSAIAAPAPTNGVFIEPTVSYINIDTPNFTYGTFSVNQGGNALNFKTSAANFMPGVTLGANFNNDFLTSLFGSSATAEVSVTHISTRHTGNVSSVPSAFYWGIEGAGVIVPFQSVFPLDTRTMIAKNVNFSSNNEITNIDLKYIGHNQIGYMGMQGVTNEPFVGGFYRHWRQDNSLSATLFDAPPTAQIPFPLNLNENIKTNYYGVQLGDAIHMPLNSQFGTFVQGTVAVGGMHATLHGSQSLQLPINFLPDKTVDNFVTNSENNWDFEAGLSAGMQWTPPTATPVKFSVSGGATWISAIPEIVNPTTISQAAHLTKTSAVNPYVQAGVTLTLPF